MINLTDDQKASINSFLENRWIVIYDKKTIYDARVLKWIKQYNSIPEDNKDSYQTNIFIPYTFGQIATLKPRLRGALFNKSQPYLSVMSDDESIKGNEEGIRDMLISVFEEAGFSRKMKDGIHDCLPQGTGWVKVGTDTENKLRLSNLDFFDVLVDFTQRGDTSNDFVDLFHRVETSEESLRALERAGVYENIDEALQTEFPQDNIIDYQLQAQAFNLSIGAISVDTEQYKEAAKLNKFEILEWWGKYNVDGMDKPARDVVFTWLNRKVLIRADYNEEGRIPIFPIRAYRKTRLSYGTSISQMAESLQYEMNEKRNQRMDALNLILKPWLKARRTASLDWDNIYQSPDNVIRMDDPEHDLLPVELQRIPGAVYQEDGQLKSDIQFAVGSADFGGSLNGGVTDTATGVSAISAGAASRYGDYVEDVSFDIMNIVEYMTYLTKKYRTLEGRIRLFDSHEWRQVTAEQLKKKFKLNFNMAALVVNPELRMQVLTNLINVIGPVADKMGIDLKPLLKRVLQLGEVRELDKVMGSERTELNDKLRELSKVQKELSASGPEDVSIERAFELINQTPGTGQVLAPSAPQTIVDPANSLLTSLTG